MYVLPFVICLQIRLLCAKQKATYLLTYLLRPTLADELHHPAESEFRRRLRSASSQTSCLFLVLDSQPTATEHFQSLPFGSGTVFRSTSHPRRHFPSSPLA